MGDGFRTIAQYSRFWTYLSFQGSGSTKSLRETQLTAHRVRGSIGGIAESTERLGLRGFSGIEPNINRCRTTNRVWR